MMSHGTISFCCMCFARDHSKLGLYATLFMLVSSFIIENALVNTLVKVFMQKVMSFVRKKSCFQFFGVQMRHGNSSPMKNKFTMKR